MGKRAWTDLSWVPCQHNALNLSGRCACRSPGLRHSRPAWNDRFQQTRILFLFSTLTFVRRFFCVHAQALVTTILEYAGAGTTVLYVFVRPPWNKQTLGTATAHNMESATQTTLLEFHRRRLYAPNRFSVGTVFARTPAFRRLRAVERRVLHHPARRTAAPLEHLPIPDARSARAASTSFVACVEFRISRCMGRFVVDSILESVVSPHRYDPSGFTRLLEHRRAHEQQVVWVLAKAATWHQHGF